MEEQAISRYLICNKLFSEFHHIFGNKFIIEECLLKSLFELTTESIHSILSLMWTIMEEQQIHDILNSLIRSIVNDYKFSPVGLTTGSQGDGHHLDLHHHNQCLSGICVHSFLIQ